MEEKDLCDICGEATRLAGIRVNRWCGDQLFVFEDVPARVCDHCGAEFIHAKHLEWMEEILGDDAKRAHYTRRTMQVPILGRE